MSRFLGIDLGTSAAKVVVVDEDQAVRASASEPIRTSRPGPLASEQDPEDWWRAVAACLDRIAADHPREMAGVAAIGLSGQMHAALLLDPSDRPIRPALLWNDGRAGREADELKALGMDAARRLGVPAMAGFTASKLLWLARHEPATLRGAASLLLPKDFLRLRLTGERATDVSDAAGTWFLDQARRDWDGEAVAASGLNPALLPRLIEGTEPAGVVRPEMARRFGLRPGVVVAGGAGDTPAGGIGIGAVEEGRGFISLGTSAQVFVASAGYHPAPERLVHAFCHGVPGRWYRMAAMLNGAGVLASLAGWLGEPDVGRLIAEAEAAPDRPSPLLMLPYLAGERTPHDDPHARGVVFGLSPSSSRAEIVRAALEGVAFSLADGLDGIASAGPRSASLAFIGGGSRSPFWGRIIAAVLGLPLRCYSGGEAGPAFGAARLARLALGPGDAESVLVEPPLAGVIEPDARLVESYRPRVEAFRRLYAAVRAEFRA